MKIIHTRKRVFGDFDYAFKHKMSLLVWILSIIKWKEYGNTVKLYCDKKTLEDVEKNGFAFLYDEIDSTYLDNDEVCEGIDFYCYWAMPKLLALRHEVVDLGNDVVIADQDVVPMSDLTRMWTNSSVTVWSNKEFIEFRSIYPKLHNLSLPKGYKLPKWFTGKAKPLNTGILHIRDKKLVDMYTAEALKMSKDNHNEHNNTNCQTMCNVEQRMLGEIVKDKGLTYSVVQPVNEGLFNKNGFHTHGYKNHVNNNNGLLWHLNLLLMIKEKNEFMFRVLISQEMFQPERDYFEKNGYTAEEVEELKKYK